MEPLEVGAERGTESGFSIEMSKHRLVLRLLAYGRRSHELRSPRIDMICTIILRGRHSARWQNTRSNLRLLAGVRTICDVRIEDPP